MEKTKRTKTQPLTQRKPKKTKTQENDNPRKRKPKKKNLHLLSRLEMLGITTPRRPCPASDDFGLGSMEHLGLVTPLKQRLALPAPPHTETEVDVDQQLQGESESFFDAEEPQPGSPQPEVSPPEERNDGPLGEE